MKGIFFALLFSAVAWAGGEGRPSSPEVDAKQKAADTQIPASANGLAPNRAGIFEDAFETGDTSRWMPEPLPVPNCNCYFSGDCFAGQFCNWGPAGPFIEDICNWRTPKPQGIPGNGCSEDVGAPGPICDGYCSDSFRGSPFGNEDPALIREALVLWSEAILRPAVEGGGPVDPDLAEAALNLPFQTPQAAMILGRHVADILNLPGGITFYDHFCHFEHQMPYLDGFVDLSGQSCLAESGRLLIQALLAELDRVDSSWDFIDRIPEPCEHWRQMFSSRCPPGEGTLACVQKRIADYAVFLTTPTLP